MERKNERRMKGKKGERKEEWKDGRNEQTRIEGTGRKEGRKDR